MLKKEKMYLPTFKKSSYRGKGIILLMIPNKEGRHYIAVKILSALLRGITSKHDSGFYCLDCPCSFITESKLELHKQVCKNKTFWNILMPSEETRILEFNQY